MKKAHRDIFLQHLIKNLFFVLWVVFFGMFVGILGYHHFENFTWVDSFANAAMILSGMGPLEPLHTDGGKLFAGCYALFSGLIFIGIIGLLLSPFLHILFRKHLDK